MTTGSALGATLVTGALTAATALYVGWNPHRRTKQALDLRRSLADHPDVHLRERWDEHCARLMRRELRRVGRSSRTLRRLLLSLALLLALGAFGAVAAFISAIVSSQDGVAVLPWVFVLCYFSVITFVLRAGVPVPGSEWEDLRLRALKRAIHRKRARKWRPAWLGHTYLAVEDWLDASWWRRLGRQRRARQIRELRSQLRDLSETPAPTARSTADADGQSNS